ncbi:DUF6584 family protein [Kitasatospora sp. NPDC051914]|uniref:DUF6584 family protein n=1 Tax=Kitasatospora sp. NPDC051914 TaxID=3154945 RepID=UPI00343832BF
MTVETALTRADADLRAGRIPVARQRLRGLVGSRPADLTARRRLAEVYRLYGEPAEAGRWTYLDEDRDPAETAAFEERYADPLARMIALAWRGPESDAPTETARTRLIEVREAATALAGYPVGWYDAKEARDELRDADGTVLEEDGSFDLVFFSCATVAVLAVLALLGLTVLGSVVFARWLF